MCELCGISSTTPEDICSAFGMYFADLATTVMSDCFDNSFASDVTERVEIIEKIYKNPDA